MLPLGKITLKGNSTEKPKATLGKFNFIYFLRHRERWKTSESGNLAKFCEMQKKYDLQLDSTTAHTRLMSDVLAQDQ